jgi:hypothetical protein
MGILIMIKIFNNPATYSKEYIQTDRCIPMFDQTQQQLMNDVINKRISYDDWTVIDSSYQSIGGNVEDSRPIFENFKKLFQQHLEQSTLNKLTGFGSFRRTDICLGCAQYIDNLHIKYPIQVLDREYNYHQRLNQKIVPKSIGTLEAGKHLIISLPRSSLGTVDPQMDEILDRCLERSIPVHIDGAWITASKNINFDFSHPAIHSLGVSLSKGYGMSGWNRIGLRWTKYPEEDSITVLNDYLQINTYSVVIANYFLKNIEPDHLWNTHGENHFKICRDFGLTPSDTIHMATEDGKVRGLSPLLQYLECTK